MKTSIVRDILAKLGAVVLVILLQFVANAQQKRIYVSNDDHTDYMWSANEIVYDSAFLHMLDWWLDYNDATSGNPASYQSKWNCDGSFWIKSYEKHRTTAQVNRLINQIRNGKITVPYSPLVVTYGAMPAEAALRAMYYAGDLERRFNLDFNMALAMENQTMPLGLSSLWKGSGAKYCWHGVCDCATEVPGSTNRENEIYWYKGLDTNKVLVKWYSILSSGQNTNLGGYAEARDADITIDSLSAKCMTVKYPYNIAAGFGFGWDNLQTTSDNLVIAAQSKSNASQQVFVSNEVDFFQDFENTYGSSLPSVTQTFGNEWEHACASIAEVSAKVKRSLEKLRAAEAMAAVVINYNSTFVEPLDSLKKEAWMSLGLYWEHAFGWAGNLSLEERNAFERRQEITISSYVNQLYTLAKSNLANLISKDVPGSNRFFVFNPLGWSRTDYADYAYNGNQNIHVIDVSSNVEVPFQFITKNAVNYLRIEADSIPSIGYKVFEIRTGPGTGFPPAGTNTGNIVENVFFKVTYTNQGVLTSILDKQNSNRQIVLLTNGNYINDLGTGTANVGNSSVENNGPVSITILTNTLAAPLAHSTRITLFKNIPRIEIDNQITQGFSTANSWAYSFNIASPTVWHEEIGAVIKAKLTNNGGHYATQNARYDWNTLNHFASVNNIDSSYGVTLSNQDCYFMKLGNSTISTLDENTAQLNVLAGGMIDGFGIDLQGGDNIFNQRFAITTHTAYSAAREMKNALEHQNYLICDSVYNPVNILPSNYYSFLTNSDSGSLIWTLKPAEEGIDNGIITRVWNLKNTNATPTLTYRLSINSAKRTTHVETDMNNNPFIANDLLTAIGHNEMKTFRVKLNINPLPIKIISFTGERIQDLNYLKWEITNENNLKKYELERSTDGQQFIKITTVFTKPGITNNYDYSDRNINNATPYFYRIKIINSDNSFGYSNIIIIRASNDAANLILYPNPVVDLLKINFILDKQMRCNLSVLNSAGGIVKTVSPPLFERGNNYYTLSLKELPAAEYILSITARNKKYVKNFIKK